mmetsp:Transcript_8014/g.17886  ORF Transcript_8014/g.17886 Transcript_8014/m.17886 type:complete len:367 (-) Transcript_8014:55-1155(-)
MVLTGELQGYAENIWKRFPEEFIALGSPGLEDHFILRNGHAHRITDTSAQKVIEIVLRRRARNALGNNDLEEMSDQEQGASMQNMPLSCSRSKERVQNGLDHLYQAVQGLASILVDCLPEDDVESPTGRSNNSPRDSLCQRRGMRQLSVNAEGKTEGVRLGKVTKIPSDNEMPGPVPSRPQATAMVDRHPGHPGHCAAPVNAQTAAVGSRGHSGHGAGEESPGTRIQRWAEKKRPGTGLAPHKAPSAPQGYQHQQQHFRGGGMAVGSHQDQAMAVAMAPASDLVARHFQLGPGCAGSCSGLDTSGIMLDSDLHATCQSLNRSGCSEQSQQTHISHNSQFQAQRQVQSFAVRGELEPGSPQKRRFRK